MQIIVEIDDSVSLDEFVKFIKSQFPGKTVFPTINVTDAKEPRRHIPLTERLKDWDGQPYEMTDEDREWLDMEPARDEILK